MHWVSVLYIPAVLFLFLSPVDPDKMPLDTVLCLDTSGSMGWNNNEGINQLKAAALKFLEGVEETARQANLKVRLARKYSVTIRPQLVETKIGLLIICCH